MREDAERNVEEGQGLLAAAAPPSSSMEHAKGLEDSEHEPAHRVFAYTVAFVGLVSFWGLLDTMVEFAARDNVMVSALIYAFLSVLCLIVLKIYQRYDTKYDPTRHLRNA
mmetsp:Transcript_48758/g.96211  ORF Transcript_48758/g.96211 Transcript_48758/m.96211 type:complete len:110 (-) Transcript_48758:203-532(-)